MIPVLSVLLHADCPVVKCLQSQSYCEECFFLCVCVCVCVCQGFMEDEGRQRTTKYISKLFVEQSQLNQRFTKERQRSQHLRVSHLSKPEPQSRVKPVPTAGAPEQQVKEALPKTHSPKQPKLSFSKQAIPFKSE